MSKLSRGRARPPPRSRGGAQLCAGSSLLPQPPARVHGREVAGGATGARSPPPGSSWSPMGRRGVLNDRQGGRLGHFEARFRRRLGGSWARCGLRWPSAPAQRRAQAYAAHLDRRGCRRTRWWSPSRESDGGHTNEGSPVAEGLWSGACRRRRRIGLGVGSGELSRGSLKGRRAVHGAVPLAGAAPRAPEAGAGGVQMCTRRREMLT